MITKTTYSAGKMFGVTEAPDGKWIDKFLVRRDGMAKYSSYFNYNCLPKINGKLVESIWSSWDLIDDEGELDDWLSYDKWHYSTYFRLHSEKSFYNVIHPEIKKLFGNQIINGRKCIVKHISFRTSSSGHASPDNIATIYCKEHSLSVYDTQTYDDYVNSTCSIHYSDRYFQKVVNTLMKKTFKVEWHNKPNPGPIEPRTSLREACTYKDWGSASGIRYIDGMIYPDALLSSWRKWGEIPYVSNNYPSRENIRIWLASINAHVYLSKVDPEKGDTNLVAVYFKGENYESFCSISTWRDSGEMVRFDVENAGDDNYHVKVSAPREKKKKIIEDIRKDCLYSVDRISYSDHKEE